MISLTGTYAKEENTAEKGKDTMLKTSVILENLEDIQGVRNTAKMLRGAGFEAVDAALFTPELVEIICGGNWRSTADALRKIMAQEGLTVYQCHTSMWEDTLHWQPKADQIKKELAFAGAIGAQNAVVHPLCPLTVSDPLMGSDHREIMEMNLQMYRQLLPAAAETGVTVCAENIFADGVHREAVPCFSTYAAELNELMDQLPGLKVCLDAGHATITGQSPADMVRQFGERLAALHLHANDHVHDLHIAPFEGAGMGWDDFCRALKQVGYQGTVNLEVMYIVRNSPEKLRPAMYKYLHECAKYLAEKVEQA